MSMFSYSQDAKVTNTDSGFSWFFFDHSFKTAAKHAQIFCERNKGKFPMKQYYRNHSPFGPTWREE